MRAGGWRASATALLVVLTVVLAGCADFPEETPTEWREQVEGAGSLGDIPRVPSAPGEQAPPSGQSQAPSGQEPGPCVDPDPLVVATCLDPIGAIAVLPDGESAFVAERLTGRVLRVSRNSAPVLVTTVPVDPSGGGGLTGLVLSPSYTEDRLLYAYATTPQDNRVVLIAGGQAPNPVLTGIPRGAADNGGSLAVDIDGSLLVATGDAGGAGADPASLAGKVLRIDTRGRPATGNPDPASPILSSGLLSPGGICVDPVRTTAWVTDRTAAADVLHLITPGALPSPAWRWPERPGVTGCTALDGTLAIGQAGAEALFVLRSDEQNVFTGNPEIQFPDVYGRLSATALGSDGRLWMGTSNKDGGVPTPTDDRVIRIEFPVGGGESRI